MGDWIEGWASGYAIMMKCYSNSVSVNLQYNYWRSKTMGLTWYIGDYAIWQRHTAKGTILEPQEDTTRREKIGVLGRNQIDGWGSREKRTIGDKVVTEIDGWRS